MTFPDRIERTIDVPHQPEKVWAALTTAEGLAGWFGSSAEIDLRPGGMARLRWEAEGHDAKLVVKVVDPPRRFAYTWGIEGLPADDPRRTFVEFTLEPVGASTRLTVVESGFAQVPDEVYSSAFNGNTEGWASELKELVEYLGAAA